MTLWRRSALCSVLLTAAALAAACGGPSITKLPGAAVTTPATPDPRAGWTAVGHFATAGRGLSASLEMPPSGWTYVPDGGSTSTGDRLQGPDGETLSMSLPNGVVGESCAAVARDAVGSGFSEAGGEPIVVDGVDTAETSWRAGGRLALETIPVQLEQPLACVVIEVTAGSGQVDQKTVDLIVTSLRFQPS